MAQNPFFYVYRDARNEWRWRLRSANLNIIADSSEGYKNKSDCEYAISLVKRIAPTAAVVHQTQ